MKPTSKKENYIVECNEAQETTTVLNDILKDNPDEFSHWKYVIKYGNDWDIDDEIKPKYHHLSVISFEEWQALPEYTHKTNQRKIIGYKLVKEEYKEAAEMIAFNHLENIKNRSFIKNKGMHFSADCIVKSNLEKAGVLDLWFEPVYENQTIKLKSGIELSETDIEEIKEILNK